MTGSVASPTSAKHLMWDSFLFSSGSNFLGKVEGPESVQKALNGSKTKTETKGLLGGPKEKKILLDEGQTWGTLQLYWYTTPLQLTLHYTMLSKLLTKPLVH